MANIPISSFTAAANATGIGMSGFSLTGANAQSMLDLAGTWNTSGTPTGLKLNVTDTASNAASLLMDLQVGGVSQFRVSKNGAVNSAARADFGDPITSGGVNAFRATGLVLGNAGEINWRSASTWSAGSTDLILARDAANILAQRNGTNAQTSRIYNTYTDASNYERGFVGWISSFFVIGTEAAGTGVNRELVFRVGGISRWNINGSGHLLTSVDNTYDIGATGANRPRDIFSSRDVYAQSNTGGFYLGAASDVAILRDDANILAQRRSTNAQTFRIYETSTDASNYSRMNIVAGTNFDIQSQAAGTGTPRNIRIFTSGSNAVQFGTAGTIRWEVSVTGNFVAQTDNTSDIGANGAGRPRDLWLGRNADVRGSVYIGGFVEFLGISTGVVCLRQFATSDFNRLQFGGTTSSFPALKRNATALETKLADDSAFAPHAMQYLDVTDGITAPGAAAGRARIYVDTADGDLKVVFADGTVKTIVTDT
jgi:hypothetical protein